MSGLNDIKNSVYDYLDKHPYSLELFHLLEDAGNLYLVGGMLREYKDNGKIESLHDMDIIISVKDRNKWNEILEQYNPVQNKFKGYKFICHDLLIDVWEIQNTYAYKEHKIICTPEEYVKNLPKTVFLNIDAIFYDWENDLWLDEFYNQAKDTNILDIVLEDNPHTDLNILRAIILKEKYHMTFSEKLVNIINKYDITELYDSISDLNRRRYKQSVSDDVIWNTLKECKNLCL